MPHSAYKAQWPFGIAPSTADKLMSPHLKSHFLNLNYSIGKIS